MDNKLSTIRKIEIYKIIILMVFVITSIFSAVCFAAAPSNFSQTTGDDGGSSTSSTTPTKITLSYSNITMYVGDSRYVSAIITPSIAKASVMWLSTNPNVASASGGTIQANAPGTAMITAKISDSLKATCNVTVLAKPKCSASTILSGHNQYLKYSYTNKKASTHDMVTTCSSCGSSWTTSNVKHTYTNSVCICGYKAQATSISLSQTSATITMGQTLSITANVNPAGAEGTIQWLSTNPDIVYARKNGDRGAVLESKGIGTAMVTAKISESIKATCNVTVVAKPKCSALSILSDHNQYLKYSYTNKKASTHDMVTTCSSCGSSWTTSNVKHTYTNSVCICGYKAQATSISLSQTSATITMGQTLSITANVNPAGAEGTIQWLSTNPDIVYARKNGDRGAVLESKGIGTAMVTAKISESIKATCNVTVVVKPTCSASSILSGHNQYLKYSYTNKKTSTHDMITTCSSCGSSWTTANVAHKYTNNVCECGYKAQATSISLSQTSATITMGQTLSITANVNPSGAEGTIQWLSTNTNVVYARKNGERGAVLETKGVGTAVVTAKISESIKATCNVTVVTKPTCSASSILSGHNQYLKYSYTNKKASTHDMVTTCSSCGSSWTTPNVAHKYINNVCVCGKNPLATGVSLNKTSATLKKGETLTLIATLSPAGSEGKVQWSSNNTKIATVSNGTIKAVAAGTATITVKVSDTVKATCVVTVVDVPKCSKSNILTGHDQYLKYEYLNKKEKTHDVKVTCTKCVETWIIQGENHTFVGAKCSICGYKLLSTGIKLDKTSATLTVGETIKLVATLSPVGSEGSIQWSTTNAKIVTVNNGTIKAVAAGTATVTAKVSNTIKATCVVKVVEEPKCSEVKILNGHNQYLKYEYSNKQANTHDVKVTCTKCVETWIIQGERHTFVKGVCSKCAQSQQVTALIINRTSANIREGETLQLSVNIIPSTVIEKIEWTSSNSKVATVSLNGLVTGVKAGTVVITAKVSNGIKATCTVVVSEKEKCSLGNVLPGHDTKINITYSETKGDTHNEHYTCTECKTSWNKEKIEHTYVKEVCVCGKPEVHDFNYTQKDETYHIVTCSNCDYNKEVKHTEGKEKCECGFSKEIVCEHPSYEWITVEEAECNKPGLKVEKCTVCEEVRNTKVIKVEHEYKVTQIEGDAEYHVGICKICGAEGAKGKHIFGVSDKCLFCKYERAPLRCQDGKILLYHGAKVVRYEKLDNEKHISIYECKKCKDEFKVEVQHFLKAKEVKEINNENHTLLMECKTCKHTFEVVNKHMYIFGKCAVCGDKETKEGVCTEEETQEGHKLTILKVEETSDGKEHIATYECKECDITYEKTEAHVFDKEDKCVCGVSADVAKLYSNGSGGANVKDNGGITTATDVKLNKKTAEKAIKENDAVEFTAFSSGLHNLETFVDAYKNVAEETGETKPATIRLIEPAYMKIGGNKNDSSKTREVFTGNERTPQEEINLIKQNVKIELVIGEKGGANREATYQETIALYLDLKAAGYNVELYAVNQDMVKYAGEDVECINIGYTPKRSSQHETAQDAAIFYWGLDKS